MGDIFDDFLEVFTTGELKLPDIFGGKTSTSNAPKIPLEQRALNKAALIAFIDSPNRVSHLTDDHARDHLEKGVVELFHSSLGHVMSGLLITQNGFLVTNYDVIEHLKEYPLMVKTADGKVHKNVRVCAPSVQNNIALLKVDMEGPTKPMKYKFTDRRSPFGTFAVSYLVRKGQKLKKHGGLINSARPESFPIKGSSKVLMNQVLIERVEREDVESGAVIVTANGELFGIASGTITSKAKTTCTSLDAILALIKSLLEAKVAKTAKK